MWLSKIDVIKTLIRITVTTSRVRSGKHNKTNKQKNRKNTYVCGSKHKFLIKNPEKHYLKIM